MKKVLAIMLVLVLVLSVVNVSFAATSKSKVTFILKANGKAVPGATLVIAKATAKSVKIIGTVKTNKSGKATMSLSAGKYRVLGGCSKLPVYYYWGVMANDFGSSVASFAVKAGVNRSVKLTCQKIEFPRANE